MASSSLVTHNIYHERSSQTAQPSPPRPESSVSLPSRLQSASSRNARDATGSDRYPLEFEQVSPLTSSQNSVREKPDLMKPLPGVVPEHIPGGNGNISSVKIDPPQRPDHSLKPTPPSSRKETQAKLRDTKPQKWWLSLWWWWEILAMILSIGCMCALVVLLFEMDGIPLHSWWYPIQPNSLIAAITTVAKTALMVPAASCISQLKWRHYKQSRHLVDLQLFDDASRGPWGSTTLMTRLIFRPSSFIAIGFALITVVALGIDSCIQQVLEFHVQPINLTDAPVILGKADAYFAKGFLEDHNGTSITTKPNPDLLAVQSIIINGVTGSVFQPYFYCPEPAFKCSWTEISTLGVCVESQNMTSTTKVDNCQNNNTGAFKCSVTFPGMLYSKNESITMTWNLGNGGDDDGTMLFQSKFLPLVGDQLPYFGALTTVTSKDSGIPTLIGNGGSYMRPPVEVFYSKFAWCVKRYHNVTATPCGLSSDPPLQELLIKDSPIEPNEPEDEMGAYYESLRANSTGVHYNISRQAYLDTPNYLAGFLTTTLRSSTRQPPGDTNLLSLGWGLYNMDIGNVTHNIAESMTNMIRSNTPGDNFNATTVSGEAFFNETYISVRWQWMILPLAETLLAAVLLMISIIITRSQPLLKTSAIAYLFFGLRGWSDEELCVSSPRSAEKMESLSEKMMARLEYDDQGRLRFTRTT